jgi:hypothetical protein
MKRNILQKLFEITGNDRDPLIYLQNFRSVAPESFALIHIDSITFSEYGESFFYDLKLLQKLDLFPVVLLEDSLFEYAKHFFQGSLNLKPNPDPAKLNFAEIPIGSDFLAVVKLAVESKKIPFLLYSNSVDEFALSALIHKLQTSKLIYLLGEPVFWDNIKNVPLSVIHLRNDFERLKDSGLINAKEIKLLAGFRFLLLENHPYLRSISITTPASLFKELFTVKGSGTYIKLGTRIEIYNSIEQLDKQKLYNLLETAFQKKIKEVFLESIIDAILLETNYKGAAIMKKHELGYALSKFAVDEIARGEGIGREIWDKMKAHFPKIFWRAKPKNPINKWYIKECDGFFKFPEWNVYWIGIDPENINGVCHYLLNLEPDFYE